MKILISNINTPEASIKSAIKWRFILSAKQNAFTSVNNAIEMQSFLKTPLENGNCFRMF